MEAMACGRCVVASNVGGNPELADGASRGILFEPGNAADLAGVLRRLIADPERRSSLGKAAREFLTAGFSIATSAARMSQIYDSFLSARKKG
jgi:glycosyltransferase involved in cell wall biosynthesis